MQPNILLIFTDQQRSDTIEALGNPIIRTPAMNRLVEAGVSFTSAYTPCPVCVAARYALHTGLMPHRTGCVDNGPMPTGHPSFMTMLSAAGYQTHGVGKMHFTFPDEGPTALWGYESRDISEQRAGPADQFAASLRQAGYAHVHDPNGVKSDMYYIPQPSQLPASLHQGTWVVNRSIDFLKRRDPDRPFFLMTSFQKPHPPFETPTPWNKLYRGPEMPLPVRPTASSELVTFWNRVQNRYKYRDQGTDDNLVRTIRAAYYSCISFIDYNVGRLLSYLDEVGLWDNTLIVFSSDHGELLGDYDCWGKRCFFDASARIPLIMKPPGSAGPAVCDRPASLIDVMPTFLQQAGAQEPPGVDGVSLADLAAGGGQRQAVTAQFQQGDLAMYMAVDRERKYVFSAPDDREWLFDRSADPMETRSRAANPMYVEETAVMRRILIDRFRRDGYTQPLDGERWRRFSARAFTSDPDAWLLFQDPPESLPSIPGYERRRVTGVGYGVPEMAGPDGTEKG